MQIIKFSLKYGISKRRVQNLGPLSTLLYATAFCQVALSHYHHQRWLSLSRRQSVSSWTSAYLINTDTHGNSRDEWVPREEIQMSYKRQMAKQVLCKEPDIIQSSNIWVGSKRKGTKHYKLLLYHSVYDDHYMHQYPDISIIPIMVSTTLILLKHTWISQIRRQLCRLWLGACSTPGLYFIQSWFLTLKKIVQRLKHYWTMFI